MDYFCPPPGPQSHQLSSLAFYCLHFIEDVAEHAREHRIFLEKLGAKGRIHLSSQGINAQLTLPVHELLRYWQFLRCRFDLDPSLCHVVLVKEHAFWHLKVKVKPQLVSYPRQIDMDLKTQSVDAVRWKRMLNEPIDQPLLIDVRNQIEWEMGRFKGAIASSQSVFRHFNRFANEIAETISPKRPIMMYCTGGIRCEFFSRILLAKGFEKTYQLRGGILRYIKDVGPDEWTGRLFVFDNRLSLQVGFDKMSQAVCEKCETGNARIYNCANVDCNALFLRCCDCYKGELGCCKGDCRKGSRVRKVSDDLSQSPFKGLGSKQISFLN